MSSKICSRCEEKLPATIEFFHVRKDSKSGLRSWCKICRKQEYKTHRSEILIRKKQYYLNNKEQRIEYQKQWQINNPDKCNMYTKRWSKNNFDKRNASKAKRRSLKLNQTPQNVNLDIIQFYYTVASTMADYEVDHIQPLSKNGLHHEDNLQILCCGLNREKGAKWPLTEKEQKKYNGFKL